MAGQVLGKDSRDVKSSCVSDKPGTGSVSWPVATDRRGNPVQTEVHGDIIINRVCAFICMCACHKSTGVP